MTTNDEPESHERWEERMREGMIAHAEHMRKSIRFDQEGNLIGICKGRPGLAELLSQVP